MLVKVITILALALGLISPLKGEEREQIAVVCSFTVIADFCHKMLNDSGLVKSLVPPLGELHHYQLNVQDVKRLSQARLVVGYSRESERWLHGWERASPGRKVLWLSAQGQSGTLPAHGWTDPSVARLMAVRLAAALKEAGMGAAGRESLLAEIDAVDVRLRTLLAGLPADRRTIITEHPSLGPFAARYGLKVAGTLLNSLDGEAADASARDYSRLLRLIRSEKVGAVVVDEGRNHEMAQRLAKDAGLPPPVAVGIESLSPPGGASPTWKAMMLRTGGLIHEALAAR